jgi:SpoIIAA-like
VPYLTDLIDDGTGLLRVGVGVLTGEEIIQAISSLTTTCTDPGRITHALVDFTHVTKLSVSEQEFQRIVEIDKAKHQDLNITRSAVVAPNGFVFGLACMYVGHTGLPDMEIKVFRTMEEAKAWLYPDPTPGHA